MSGSRLGRGRGGRLAVYGGCGVVVVLLFFLYRAATSEMARLRELHVQCAHQQEALAAQLQVIFEYKVRLEKSLAEEKSSNAAVKQELQQRATREKSLRDKDSIEALQRFNSLQQTYKLLQTEHQDLLEECKKREKQALEDTNRLETTLQDLRSRIRQAREDKEKSMQHLKTRYLELDIEKTKLEEKCNEMLKTNSNTDSTIDHLKKEVFQLKRELEEAKKSLKKATSPGPNPVSPQSSQRAEQVVPKSGGQGSVSQPIGPSPQQQQQSTSPTNSMKAIPALKIETSTLSSSGNPPSTASEKAAPPSKQASKVKLPVGVLPIPVIIDPKLENREEKHPEDDEARKKDEARQNAPIRSNVDSKENEKIEAGILDPPFHVVPGRHIDEQIAERRGNGGWFRVGPGVQEIGDELNHLGQLPGLDDAADRQAEAGDDQYEPADYDKEPQQKNNDLHLVEGEDEGEDEDDQLDYPQNLKQEKHE